MDCQTARDTLWPPERPRLVVEDVAAARRHVDTCEACRDYFRQDRHLLAAYRRLGEQRAPASVRERVFTALARERDGGRGQGRRPWRPGRATGWAWGAAAAAVFATVLLMSGGGSASEEAPPEAFIEDYMRRAVAEDRIDSSDPAAVSHFLTRELGMALKPLMIEGYRLAGAETCLLGGQRGAMVIYERAGETLSHYLLPVPRSSDRDPRLSSGESALSPAVTGPAVVTWVSGSLEHALVGAVDPQKLLTIARASAPLD